MILYECVPALDGQGLVAVQMDSLGRGRQPVRLSLAWLVWRYSSLGLFYRQEANS